VQRYYFFGKYKCFVGKSVGRWKMEAGSWKMEDGSWKMEDGSWKNH
jgi:hypothetical protein